MTNGNPFEYQRIVEGRTFINREEELKILTQAMHQRENILLYSPRRLGKSSLLKQASATIKEKNLVIIYIDLWECLSEKEIAEKIATEVLTTLCTTLEKITTELKELVTSARPVITVESEGFGIRFDFIEKDKTLRETLAMIQTLAARRDKSVVLILDESQVIAEIEDHRIEKIFRSVIQRQDRVSYIFSGSKQHILKAMISLKTRPFYRQLRPMTLGPISKDAFRPYIQEGFSRLGGITDDSIDEIFHYTQGNPQRTQQLCHFLYTAVSDGKKLSPQLVKDIMTDLCRLLDKEFQDELDVIKNTRQRKILKALAMDESQGPFSAGFLKEHSLGALTSVQTALKGLVEKGVLDEQYRFVDPLMKTWLQFRQHEDIFRKHK